MNAIRRICPVDHPGFVLSTDRGTRRPAGPSAARVALACRWQLAADGRPTCVWERVASPLPRRPSLSLVPR
jgi:hypothetical protein